MNHIAKHKIDIDLKALRNEIHSNWVKIDYDSSAVLNSAWKKYSLDNCEQVQELNQFYTDLLECKVTPLCYFQPAGFSILKHIDTSCKSSINIILNETTSAPVHFFDDEGNKFMYFYRCALLNVGGYYHEVPVHSYDRIILRFALQTPFDDAKEKLNQGVMNESPGL